ncbi:hypothetical protein MXAN_0757 [Myxococcus xanthus DK 1622]|uniref:Uncharacterized protein n=1 Tax=Myxococcus xanthus (strain DK1622) TaxID=246197 RepID=Q1DEA1_MYXXD|nr:hypothetical protein MXAN_0757 [Myxococcus xanthus DK 1622]
MLQPGVPSRRSGGARKRPPGRHPNVGQQTLRVGADAVEVRQLLARAPVEPGAGAARTARTDLEGDAAIRVADRRARATPHAHRGPTATTTASAARAARAAGTTLAAGTAGRPVDDDASVDDASVPHDLAAVAAVSAFASGASGTAFATLATRASAERAQHAAFLHGRLGTDEQQGDGRAATAAAAAAFTATAAGAARATSAAASDNRVFEFAASARPAAATAGARRAAAAGLALLSGDPGPVAQHPRARAAAARSPEASFRAALASLAGVGVADALEPGARGVRCLAARAACAAHFAGPTRAAIPSWIAAAAANHPRAARGLDAIRAGDGGGRPALSRIGVAAEAVPSFTSVRAAQARVPRLAGGALATRARGQGDVTQTDPGGVHHAHGDGGLTGAGRGGGADLHVLHQHTGVLESLHRQPQRAGVEHGHAVRGATPTATASGISAVQRDGDVQHQVRLVVGAAREEQVARAAIQFAQHRQRAAHGAQRRLPGAHARVVIPVHGVDEEPRVRLAIHAVTVGIGEGVVGKVLAGDGRTGGDVGLAASLVAAALPGTVEVVASARTERRHERRTRGAEHPGLPHDSPRIQGNVPDRPTMPPPGTTAAEGCTFAGSSPGSRNITAPATSPAAPSPMATRLSVCARRPDDASPSALSSGASGAPPLSSREYLSPACR